MNLHLKTLLLCSLIALPLLCTGQQHCISLEISRKLHHDARRSYIQDTLISEFEGKILILQQETASIRENLGAQLTIEREKNVLLASNEDSFKAQILNSQSEARYFKKKERKARRERNVAIGAGAIALILAAVK